MSNKKVKYRLFVVNYGVHANREDYRGSAIVKALTVSQAKGTFLNQSDFNGYQDAVKISRIQEIFLTPEPALISEEYVKSGFSEDK